MKWFPVLVAACLGGNLHAHAQPDEHAVPTEMCRGYFMVPLTLSADDGRPEERTLWFLHDTGATTTYVDPDSLERVAGHRIDSTRVRIRNATAGPVTYHSLRARVTDLDHLSRSLGREIDGVLAYDAFGDRLLILDYESEQIRIRDGRLPPPDGQTIFDADGPDKRPWLQMHFPGRTRRMLIDSGAAQTVLAINDIDRYPTVEAPRAVGAAMRFRTVEPRSGARLDGQVRMGPHRLERPTLQSTPGSELIGGRIMRYFTWTFDPVQDRVQIVRNDLPAAIAFDPIYGHGMILAPNDIGLRVAGVLAGAPAERAGIQVGDVVTHFNGEPLISRDCDANPGADLLVTLLRAGDRIDVLIDVETLVD
ncbi:PDZ domain-containing protein [Maricaulis sp.]|uniref:PDZ domain-containing protein n=1 Tax=Maricaulis sp. TaxID=1486257 RepID=UPI00260DB97B|nr:PDZ domain-containing protein [Maricaulis sp.]